MNAISSLTLFGLALSLLSGCLLDGSGNVDQTANNELEILSSKVVVGTKDDRHIMPNSQVNPTIVAFVTGADHLVCTGTTIGLSHVITAAHCVYDEEKKELKKNITLIPGLHLAGNIKKGSRYFMKRIFIIKDYIEDTGYNGYTSYASSKDIAIIQVQEFKENKYFSDESPKAYFGDIENFQVRGEKLGMIGYHHDDKTERGSQYYTQECYSYGRRHQYTAFYHNCDTAEGSSGSAIISNGEIVGIHTGKAGGSVNNSAAMITTSILEDIDKITLYETAGLKNFKVYEPKVDFYSTISVKNLCHEPIEFSVAFKNSAGHLKGTQRVRLEANKLKLLDIDTKESNIYFNGQSLSGRKVWEGSSSFDFGNGRIMDFMDVDLINLNGDTTLRLNCN